MTEKIDYIKYKLQRADDAIRSAEVLLKENLWLDTLSKIYYAAFYGVSALLIDMKLNPKTHGEQKLCFIRNLFLLG